MSRNPFDAAWLLLKGGFTYGRERKDKEWPEDYMYSYKDKKEKPVTGRFEDSSYYRQLGPAAMLPMTGVSEEFPSDYMEYSNKDVPPHARSDPMKNPNRDGPHLQAIPVSQPHLEPAARASAVNDGTFSTDLSDERMQEKAKEWENRKNDY